MNIRGLLCLLTLLPVAGLQAARPGLEREPDWRRLEDHHVRQDLNKIYGGPRWLDDMEQARKLALLQRNDLLVLFSKRGDEHSAALKRDTLGDEKVWKALGHFTLVELDIEQYFELAFEYRLQATPTLIWMTPEGRELRRVEGEVSADDLKAFIERIRNPQAVQLPPVQAGRIQRFRKSDGDPEVMAEILQDFSGEGSAALREELRQLDPPPLQSWVKLLDHPALQVRLAALELLEERSGKAFNYDPWQPADTQTAALREWQEWLANLDSENPQRFAPLTRQQLADCIRDLNSDSNAHVLRATQRIETAGPELLPHIQEILKSEELSETQIKRLNEVLLTLRLSSLGWPDAPGSAFRLRRGPVNTRMKLISKLGGAGPAAVPVLEVFLDDPEVLIREAVMENLLEAGGEEALPVVLSRMEKEPSVDIALAVMRRIATMTDQEATDWLKTQLNSDQEERILGALQAMQTGKHDDLGAETLKLLDDTRWRVRAQTAVTLGAIQYKEGLKELMAHRNDPDDFTRMAILDASLKMLRDNKKRGELISKWFDENPDDASSILALTCERRIELPDNLIQAALEMEKNDLLGLMQIFLECGDTAIPVALQVVEHEDHDIRVAALRVLARYGMGVDDRKQARKSEALLAKAFQEESEKVIEVLLQNLSLKTDNDIRISFKNDLNSAANQEMDDLLAAFGDLEEVSTAKTAAPEESLDDLLGAFADPESSEGSDPESGGTDMSLLQVLEKLFKESANPAIVNSCAITLAQQGNGEAFSHMLTVLPDLDEEILEHLLYRYDDNDLGQQLAVALKEDKREELRNRALLVLAAYNPAGEFLPMVDSLGEEGSTLSLRTLPLDSWGLKQGLEEIKEREARPFIEKWLMEEEGETLSEEVRFRKLLALQLVLITRHRSSQDTIRELAENHQDPDVRALAWLTVASANRGLNEEESKLIQNDSALKVQQVLPFLYIRSDHKEWQIAPEISVDYSLSNSMVNSRWTLFPDETAQASLSRQLQSQDLHQLQALSGLALHTQRKEIENQDSWLESLRRSPPKSWAVELSAQILYYEFQRVRKPEGPIVDWLLQHYGDAYQAESLRRKMNKTETVLVASTAEKISTPLAGAEEAEAEAAPVVVYIYSQSCDDCETVDQFLKSYLKTYPDLKIQAVDISRPGAEELYAALFRKFNLPLTGVGLTPMLAGANDIASGSEDLTFEKVGEIIASSLDGSGSTWIPVLQAEPEPELSFEPIVEETDAAVSAEPESAPAPLLPVQAVLLLVMPAMLLLLAPALKAARGFALLPLLGMGAGLLIADAPLLMLVNLAAALLPLSLWFTRQAPGGEERSLMTELSASNRPARNVLLVLPLLLLFLCFWVLPLRIPELLTLSLPWQKIAALGLTLLAGAALFLHSRKLRLLCACAVSLLLISVSL